MNVIELDRLTKQYGNYRGITDVSLTIKEGEIFGFIGPNGAGKSTTIRTLLGLIYPTSGSAKIFGKDIAKHSVEIKRNIGYLPSEVFYYEKMKVIDLLKYSASFYKKDCTTRILELSDLLQLDLHKKLDDLSLGNKKKVGIIQGLLHEPKLIILDEPTSGLDPLMQQIFFDLIQQENNKGATILFSSHILSEVQKLCDRVAIIKDGKIIQIRSMEELTNNQYKKFKIETFSPVEQELFSITGVNQLQVDNQIISFIYNGDINEITRILADLKLTNLIVEEPSLEEIFMHYYEKEEL